MANDTVSIRQASDQSQHSREQLIQKAAVQLERAEARICLPRNPKLQEKVRAAAKARLLARGLRA